MFTEKRAINVHLKQQHSLGALTDVVIDVYNYQLIRRGSVTNRLLILLMNSIYPSVPLNYMISTLICLVH